MASYYVVTVYMSLNICTAKDVFVLQPHLAEPVPSRVVYLLLQPVLLY
jgi:hypothetical protein